MKKFIMAVAVLAAALSVRAAGGYSCSLRVGNSSATQTISKGGVKSSRSWNTSQSSKSKTVSRSLTWPVSGSVRGEPLPSGDDVKLKCYFIGTTNGKSAMLGEETKDVVLDEKGNFKLDVTSPTEKLVHTTTTTKSGGRVRWWGGHRRTTGGSTSTKSSTSGSRVTGCIIQLVIKGKVEKAYASHPGWSTYAKSDPLPEEDILKIR